MICHSTSAYCRQSGPPTGASADGGTRLGAANDAADIVADAEERAILKILDSANEKELPPLIRFMTSRSMLTASIVMRAACTGQMHLVKIAMAHLASVPLARVEETLCGRGLGFNALYRSSGLPSTCIGLFRAAGRVERELRETRRTLDAENFARRLIEEIMTGDGAMPQADRAKYLDFIARYSSERVRVIASRLREGLIQAA